MRHVRWTDVGPLFRAGWKVAAALLAAGLLVSPVPAGAQEEPPTFPGGTEVVVLDMVVRDDAGELVTDLRPDEIEVREDGVSCLVRSFRLVRAGERAPEEAAPDVPGGPGPARESVSSSGEGGDPLRPNIVILVFGRLGMVAAGNAREAAVDFARREFPPGTWFAVYEIGDRVEVRQRITSDADALLPAIEQATTGVGQVGDRTADGETVTQAALSAALLASGDPTGVEGVDPVTAAIMRQPVGYAEQRQRDVEGQMGRLADTLSRERLGGSALRALLAIARDLNTLKGRKTLLLFSEGLHVPSGLTDLLETLVSEANRSNLAIYALDPRGLRTEGSFDDARRALLVARNISEQTQKTRDPQTAAGQEARTDPELDQSVSPTEVQMHGIAEDSLRMNTQANLRDVAEATGGFLVADTNDLSAGIERVGADLRGYYEVSYHPANPFADGTFRAIDVTVSRPGVRVRTRRGYFARPPEEAPTLEPHEMALAQALDLPTPPRDFGHRVVLEPVAGLPGQSQTQLALYVPLRALQFDYDQAGRRYHAHFAVLAVVRDGDGNVVTRLSHDWPFAGPLMDAPGVRNQSATVKRTLDLAPGPYTVESAVGDRLGGGLSVQTVILEVAGEAPATSP